MTDQQSPKQIIQKVSRDASLTEDILLALRKEGERRIRDESQDPGIRFTRNGTARFVQVEEIEQGKDS